MKCKTGFRKVGNKCVRTRDRISPFRDGVTQPNKYVRYLIIILAIVLSFIFVQNPDSRSPIGISLIFLGISLFVYSMREYQDDLIGIRVKTILPAIGHAITFVFGFYIITSLVPFFSLAFPRFPGSIGTGLKWVLVVLVSPLVETIFFQSTVFAFFRNFNKKYKYFWIILVSFMFSLFHLSSYILGFYTLDIVQGWTAFTSNFSAFLTAFLFSTTAMLFALRNGVEKANFTFIALFHMGLNLIAFGLAVITFV